MTNHDTNQPPPLDGAASLRALVEDFRRREGVCSSYELQHKAEGNALSAEFHRGAAMAFKEMAEKVTALAAIPPVSPARTTTDDLTRRGDPAASGPAGSSRSQPKGSQR